MDWKNESLSDLINYIITQYHGYLQKNMSEISKLTTTILKVHGSTHRELSKVHRLFHIIEINLVQHMLKQETGIFPYVKQYTRKPSKELLDEIFVEKDFLESEQDDIESLLNQLRQVTDEYSAPEDGCMTYDKTYELLKEFDSNVLEHLDIENRILFSRLKEHSCNK